MNTTETKEMKPSELKAATVNTLAMIRSQWRALQKPEHQHHTSGFMFCAFPLLDHIEATTHPDELWTHLPEESELTDQSRIGDHLAVTRKLLGMIP